MSAACRGMRGGGGVREVRHEAGPDTPSLRTARLRVQCQHKPHMAILSARGSAPKTKFLMLQWCLPHPRHMIWVAGREREGGGRNLLHVAVVH